MAKVIKTVDFSTSTTGESAAIYTCPAGKVAEIKFTRIHSGYMSIRYYKSGSPDSLIIFNTGTNSRSNDVVSLYDNNGAAIDADIMTASSGNSFGKYPRKQYMVPGSYITVYTSTGKSEVAAIIVEEDIT